MKAITRSEARSYLAGCLKGDAWLSKSKDKMKRVYLCMRVIDYEFAAEFSRCITLGYGLNSSVTVDDRSYYLVRRYNKAQMFNELLTFEPKSKKEKQMWLRGVFDSEGSVEAKQTLKNSNWSRRVAMFSTNMDTLKRVKRYLSDLGISTRSICEWSMTDSHIGTKQVYAVILNSGKRNFLRFLNRVGFTIFRHQVNVHKLCASYSVKSKKELAREGQRKGAESKRNKFHNCVLPEILKALKVYVESGGKSTMRECTKHVPKYGTALKYFNHSFLLEKIK